MRAKKSYGQHFLTNEHYAQRIADALQLTDQYDQVVEVGPGQGMLTKYLVEKDFKLKVIEADWDMVDYIRDHFPQLDPENDIIQADFLKVPLAQYFPGSFAIIGNYPYNISSQILFRTIEYRNQVPEMVGMFQKEVAERVAAPPGSKTYGILSVLVQAYFEVNYLFSVSPGNFNPPPKVQSGVIRLVRRPVLDLGVNDKLFKRVVKTAFSQRRKMLRNTMKSIVPDTALLKEPFLQQRPERLGVEDFVQLTKWISAELNGA